MRLQTDDYLNALSAKVADAILQNVRFTTTSINGKSSSQDVQLPVAQIAEQLVDVMEERGLVPAGYKPRSRMTVARFV